MILLEDILKLHKYSIQNTVDQTDFGIPIY
jgi:hypothetical protein